MTTATRAETKAERLFEVTAAGNQMKVDRANGIIRRVKIIGFNSANARTYTQTAISKARGLYEGAKVNVNHPKGRGDSPRDYQERIGVLRNVTMESDGLRGDFHFNPKHPLAEQLIWDAQNAPENVGFSHNAEGVTRRRSGKVFVEEISHVHSVDLVADPATNRSLFESMQQDGTTDFKAGIDSLVVKVVNDSSLSVKQKLKKLEDILQTRERLAIDDSGSDPATTKTGANKRLPSGGADVLPADAPYQVQESKRRPRESAGKVPEFKTAQERAAWLRR